VIASHSGRCITSRADALRFLRHPCSEASGYRFWRRARKSGARQTVFRHWRLRPPDRSAPAAWSPSASRGGTIPAGSRTPSRAAACLSSAAEPRPRLAGLEDHRPPARRPTKWVSRHGDYMSSKTMLIPSWHCEDCRFLAEWVQRDHPEVEVWSLGATVRPRADNARLCDRCHCRRQADDGINEWIAASQGRALHGCDRRLRIHRPGPRTRRN
jgi:hypothetical protein